MCFFSLSLGPRASVRVVPLSYRGPLATAVATFLSARFNGPNKRRCILIVFLEWVQGDGRRRWEEEERLILIVSLPSAPFSLNRVSWGCHFVFCVSDVLFFRFVSFAPFIFLIFPNLPSPPAPFLLSPAILVLRKRGVIRRAILREPYSTDDDAALRFNPQPSSAFPSPLACAISHLASRSPLFCALLRACARGRAR